VQSLGWAGAVKICSRWFAFRGYGTIMAILSLSYLFGDAAAREFMGFLISHGIGWRGVFVTTAGVLAILLVACTRLRESPAEVGEAEPAENPANLFQASAHPASLEKLLRPFFSSGVFWMACALSLGTTILRETFGLWTPTYLTQTAGMTPGDAAGASALFPFFGGLSVILCGWLSDRLGRSGRAALLAVSLVLATVALLVVGTGLLHDSSIVPVLLVAVGGFLIVGPYSFLGGAIAMDFGGKAGAGTASGIIDGIGYLGGVLAGDTMARISVQFGWSGAFLALAGVAAISSFAAGAFLWRESQIR
jgi:sugar phosphate permease